MTNDDILAGRTHACSYVELEAARADKGARLRVAAEPMNSVSFFPGPHPGAVAVRAESLVSPACPDLAAVGEPWAEPAVVADTPAALIARVTAGGDAGLVECGECRGRGGSYRHLPDDPTNRLMHGEHWYDCLTCEGTGKVAPEPAVCETCDGTGIGACPDVAEYVEIEGACPRCGGSGKAPDGGH